MRTPMRSSARSPAGRRRRRILAWKTGPMSTVGRAITSEASRQSQSSAVMFYPEGRGHDPQRKEQRRTHPAPDRGVGAAELAQSGLSRWNVVGDFAAAEPRRGDLPFGRGGG